jgi:sarcosine oxidase subunit gamma
VSEPVSLQDVTAWSRIGMKGPRAAEWLQSRGIRLPERANSWCAFAGDDPLSTDIVVRLGASEFLIEHSNVDALEGLTRELQTPISGVYPVMHEDRVLSLAGPASADLLAQVCNVNFPALAATEQPAVMTMMIGVSVIVVPQGNGARRCYRIWCDPSYGDYLSASLQQVADEINALRRTEQ